MADNKSAAHARPTAAASSTTFIPSMEWLKPLSEGPTKFYGELFGFMAKRLRTQADFFQGLADCDNPSDLLKHQANFIQAAWQSYSEDAQKALSSIQASVTAARPPEKQ